MNPRDGDPLDASRDRPFGLLLPPGLTAENTRDGWIEVKRTAKLRPWLLRYVLVFGLICAVLYVLNLTTLVIALVSVIVFAAGYYQGWKDAA